MSDLLIIILTGAGCLGGGLFLGKTMFNKNYENLEKEAIAKADSIVTNAELTAENIKKDRILEAKEKFLKLKQEFEEESNNKKNIIIQNEQKIRQREQQLNTLLEQTKRTETELLGQKQSLQAQTENYKRRQDEVEKKAIEAEQILSQNIAALEKISNLTAEEAKAELVKNLTAEAETKASSIIKKHH